MMHEMWRKNKTCYQSKKKLKMNMAMTKYYKHYYEEYTHYLDKVVLAFYCYYEIFVKWSNLFLQTC